MFEIIRYSGERKAEWDEFIDRSKNGTFLLKRGYMDYHSDRFDDFSLMFFLKNRLYAVFPSNVNGEILYSHQGLTYGGMITDGNARTAEICTLFDDMNRFLTANGIKKVVYKAVPWIYFTQPAEEDLYALTNVCRAKLIYREISSAIILDNKRPFSELRRRCCRKAGKAGITVEDSLDFGTFWKILDNNLENKYGVSPVHTCEELEMLAGRFPDNIRLYMSYLGDVALGGVVVYLNKETVHIQYISATTEGKKLGALDILFDELINNVFSDLKYFDFGKSTEQNGTYLNGQLIFQKEGFGARGVCYDTYEWETEKLRIKN